MDRRRLILLAALAALSLARPAQAGLQNDVPSCYAANGIRPVIAQGYSRLIYVLIDQTVTWNADLRASITDNLNSNLSPGTKFVVAEFSAFSQGRYLEVVHTGIIEAPMPEDQVDNTAIQKTRIFNACLADQLPYAIALADGAVSSILQASSSSLDHSDIMSALQAVSTSIATDGAARKLLFVATDGLENSDVTSFYRHNAIRIVDPVAEMKRAEAAALFGDFGGAKVYVIGGALAPATRTGATGGDYRSPRMLEALATFWRSYFERSNAHLVAFGEPALVEPVQF